MGSKCSLSEPIMVSSTPNASFSLDLIVNSASRRPYHAEFWMLGEQTYWADMSNAQALKAKLRKFRKSIAPPPANR